MSDARGLLNHSGGELAEALARQCAGVFGGRTFTDEEIKAAADAALYAIAEEYMAADLPSSGSGRGTDD